MNEDFRILEGSDAFLYERGGSLIERAEGVSLATAHGLAVCSSSIFTKAGKQHFEHCAFSRRKVSGYRHRDEVIMIVKLAGTGHDNYLFCVNQLICRFSFGTFRSA